MVCAYTEWPHHSLPYGFFTYVYLHRWALLVDTVYCLRFVYSLHCLFTSTDGRESSRVLWHRVPFSILRQRAARRTDSRRLKSSTSYSRRWFRCKLHDARFCTPCGEEWVENACHFTYHNERRSLFKSILAGQFLSQWLEVRAMRDQIFL